MAHTTTYLMAAQPALQSQAQYKYVRPQPDMARYLNAIKPSGVPKFTESTKEGSGGPLHFLPHCEAVAVGMSYTRLLRDGTLMAGTELALGVSAALYLPAVYFLVGTNDPAAHASLGGVDYAAAAAGRVMLMGGRAVRKMGSTRACVTFLQCLASCARTRDANMHRLTHACRRL